MADIGITRTTPFELLNHSDLADMPDLTGVNSDHDARYLKLDGTNVPTANYNWTTNLTTTGTIQSGTLTDGNISFTGGVGTGLVSLTDGTASWDGNNLSGFGTISATTSVTASTLTIAGGSITDTTGAISFGNENLSTTGTFTASNLSDMDDGTAQGQLGFWDSATGKWVHSETSEIFWDDVNKRLGIGTANPDGVLHMLGSVIYHERASAQPVLRCYRNDLSPNDNDILLNWEGIGNNDNGEESTFAKIKVLSTDVSDGSEGGAITFETANGIYMTEHVRIDKDGNVGIGTTAPLAKLQVGSGAVHSSASSIGRFSKAVSGEEVVALSLSNNAASLVADNAVSLGFHLSLGTGATAKISSIYEGTGANTGLGFYTYDGTLSKNMYIAGNGNVGIGTIAPTQPLSVKEKSCMTAIGGFAIKLTNKTGANSVAGKLVKADTANNDAVILTGANDDECFGVFVDSGISDGSEAWVVILGIADVAMKDNTAATRGNWVSTSSEAGYADATSATPAAAPTHFEEIGHCLESVATGGAGTHILARCVLHFN